MAAELDFYQIYYADEHIGKLYDFAIPYKNETLTHYFENDVICKLVPESTADLIGVASWRLAQKRGDMFRLQDKSLSKDKILNADFDIAVLTPRSPNHKMLQMASAWHKESWDIAFNELKKFIKVPKEVTHAIYENHFIAKREIYHAYVNDCLRPVMYYMSGKDCFLFDAGYAKRKTEREVRAYRDLTERIDWPIAPFILERLFSIWIEGKGLKVISL